MKRKFLYLALIHFLYCHLIPDPIKNNFVFLKLFNRSTISNLQVVSSIPKDKTTNVPLNSNLFLIFNRAITGVSESDLEIKDATGKIQTGSIKIENQYLSFTPKPFYQTLMTYTVSFKSKFVFSFTTGTILDLTPPFVVSSSPESGETGFPLNATLIFNMNELIDPTSINSGNLVITGGILGTRNVDTNLISFDPSSNFEPNSPYIITLRAGVRDLSGNSSTVPYSILFTTGSNSAETNCKYDFGIFNSCLFE